MRNGLPLDGSVNLTAHSDTKTVLDLLMLTEEDLFSSPGIGPGVVIVVKQALATSGLTLAPEPEAHTSSSNTWNTPSVAET